MRICLSFLIAVSLAGTAAAQTLAPELDQRVQPRRPARPAVRPHISYRVFGALAEQAFSATTTFKGIFDSGAGLFAGGGAQVILPGGVFAEVSLSRFSRTGERAFRDGGETFRLGIPLKVAITPVEVTGGYRFRLRRHRLLVPYLGGGVGSYGYNEKSEPADDLSVRHIGYLAAGGVEIRVQRWIALDIGAQFTHIPGILGSAGISQNAGEHDLGGSAARFRVSVGR